MNKFNGLATILVASMMILGGLLWPGEAQADQDLNQRISGDSGSIDAASTPAVSDRERRRAEKARRKAERRAQKEAQRAAKKDAVRAQKVSQKADKKKPGGLICKRERVSGTHLRKKVCRSQEQIDAQREQDQRSIRDINPSGAVTPG